MNVYITGGTTGIGLDLAKKYQQQGHRVGVCGRDLAKLSEEDRALFTCFQLDVCDREAVLSSVREFVGRGSLDLMIANAGISMGVKSKYPDMEAYRKVFNTNIFGVLHAFEAALEIMKNQNEGQLVAIASVAGMMGLPGAGAYCGSKAAVLKLCESWSIDLRETGVSVTAISPGFIDTPLTRVNKHPMPFLISSEKATGMIQKAIRQKKPLYIFPFPMRMTALFLEKIPRFVYRWIMTLNFANYSEEAS